MNTTTTTPIIPNTRGSLDFQLEERATRRHALQNHRRSRSLDGLVTQGTFVMPSLNEGFCYGLFPPDRPQKPSTSTRASESASAAPKKAERSESGEKMSRWFKKMFKKEKSTEDGLEPFSELTVGKEDGIWPGEPEEETGKKRLFGLLRSKPPPPQLIIENISWPVGRNPTRTVTGEGFYGGVHHVDPRELQ